MINVMDDIMKYDVAIVGAGIIGLSHAYAAAKRGLNVLVCERTDRPLGASIRNFGFGVVMGQREGEMLSLAQSSRKIWGNWAEQAGFLARSQGSLLIARNQLESAVLESFVATKAKKYGYDCELLTEQQIHQLYDGQFSRYSTILHGKEDRVVFSREAIPSIVAYLAAMTNVTMSFSTLVKEVDGESGRLNTTQGQFQADKIIVCSGHDYQTLLSEALAKLDPVVCRLQMLRVKPKQPIALQHAVFTGLSCTHYDAFRDLPATEALRIAMENDYPEYVKHGIHLLITPTPYGDLIVGDSHEYSQYPQPFSNEEIDDILLSLVTEVLDTEVSVVERWAGEYGSRGSEPYSMIHVDNNLMAVLMRTGLGMSVGPALGEKVIAELFD